MWNKEEKRKCNFNIPEIRLRTKTGYIRRVGSFSACPKFREVPAVMLVHLSDYVRLSSSQTHHQFETLVFPISRHTCTRCRKVILAYSEQLELQTAFSPYLYQPVQARWTVPLMGDTLLQILASKWRHPDRTYADMVANLVCVSLCHRTHGEGEGLMASSPAKPAGRRQDPMGHIPFGGNTLRD